MNIYLKELKRYRLQLVFWSLGVIGFLVSAMSKYQGFSKSGTSLTETLESLPAGLSAIFGLGELDLTTAGGYFALSVMYLSIMLGVHAVLIGSGIISKEETEKTVEFLFSKPVSRTRVLTAKLLAALTEAIALNLVTMAASIVIVAAFNDGQAITADIIFLMPCILFIQLIFLMVGISFAAVLPRPRHAGMTAAAVLLATFILSAFVDVSEKYGFLRYLTPFKYFDARTVFTDGRYDPAYMIITLVVIASLLLISRFAYRRRDLFLP